LAPVSGICVGSAAAPGGATSPLSSFATRAAPPNAQRDPTSYLTLPAQALSYKLGEQAWLQARATVEMQAGESFTLKRFHTQARNLGPLGLDDLTQTIEASFPTARSN
jgi:uncharacterized protein (DUF885 family)